MSEITDGELDDLLRMAKADVGDEARQRLRMTLGMIKGVVAAKGRKMSQAKRNRKLKAVEAAAAKLRNAYKALDLPTHAALYEESWRDGTLPTDDELDEPLTFQLDLLPRILRENPRPPRKKTASHRPPPSLLADILGDLADAAHRAGGQDAGAGGRPRGEGADEAVRMLADFIRRYAKIKASPKPEGPFHLFAQRALLAATGEAHNLRRPMKRVLRAEETRNQKI
jgi:hypothetical protein